MMPFVKTEIQPQQTQHIIINIRDKAIRMANVYVQCTYDIIEFI